MAELRHRWLRLALGLIFVVLALVQAQDLGRALQAQARLRDRLLADGRQQVAAARPQLVVRLGKGGEDGWGAVAREALGRGLATEVEVFEPTGRRLLAMPAPSPANHWPSGAERQALKRGELLTAGPFAADGVRVLQYLLLQDSGEGRVLLRLSLLVPELGVDRSERQQLFVSHGFALAVLALGVALSLLALRDPPAPPPPAALDVYEQAMERLRDRGQEQSAAHLAEKRRMEDQIRDKDAMARAGELTAGIVHEVRNGLGTIVGYARLLERESTSPLPGAEAALRIREECETLEVVIRRFMDFVRRETLNLAPFDLARFLSRVAARESRSRPGAEVGLPAGELGTLRGDEELLERAFENLVRNAREAAGPQGTVRLDVRRQGETVAITVADDGPGLPPATRLRPFFTTKPGGLGLGLPIALKIVRLHDGDLQLTPRAPRGLEVTVLLPVDGPKGAPDATEGSR